MKNEIDAEWKNNQTGLRQSWERKQERRERGKERKAKLIVWKDTKWVFIDSL